MISAARSALLGAVIGIIMLESCVKGYADAGLTHHSLNIRPLIVLGERYCGMIAIKTPAKLKPSWSPKRIYIIKLTEHVQTSTASGRSLKCLNKLCLSKAGSRDNIALKLSPQGEL